MDTFCNLKTFPEGLWGGGHEISKGMASPDIVGPLSRYDHPWKKNASVIFIMAKNTKFHIFPGRSLKPLQ